MSHFLKIKQKTKLINSNWTHLGSISLLFTYFCKLVCIEKLPFVQKGRVCKFNSNKDLIIQILMRQAIIQIFMSKYFRLQLVLYRNFQSISFLLYLGVFFLFYAGESYCLLEDNGDNIPSKATDLPTDELESLLKSIESEDFLRKLIHAKGMDTPGCASFKHSLEVSLRQLEIKNCKQFSKLYFENCIRNVVDKEELLDPTTERAKFCNKIMLTTLKRYCCGK